MNPINVKGTHDITFEDGPYFAYIREAFQWICSTYGYRYIEPPVLEYTEVFSRGTGESSDIVRKEMYTFLDKGDRSVTMRPEFTAGVIRSIVSNKLYATSDLPLKTFYFGPAFRYERPQLGRYRQFYQAGVECVGIDSPLLDAETLMLALSVLKELGFENLHVKVNTLGGKESRLRYREALKEYFSKHIDAMCEDCHSRLELNPLRILDCKVPEDHTLTLNAPKMRDYLTEEDEQRFVSVLSYLATSNIDYEVDETLVRGLDYYGGLVFEIHGAGELGEDIGALCGGGHYEGLLKAFGGPEEFDVGVGFALGVDRIIALMKQNPKAPKPSDDIDIYMMPLGDLAQNNLFFLAQDLREGGLKVEMPYKGGKLAAMFKKATKRNAHIALIAGDDEINGNYIQVKDLLTQEQKKVEMDVLGEAIEKILLSHEEDDDCDDPNCEHHHHHREE